LRGLLLEKLGEDAVLAQDVLLHDLDVGLGLLEEVDLLDQELPESHRSPGLQLLQLGLQLLHGLRVWGDEVAVEVVCMGVGVLSFLRRRRMWVT
jgi:hypothetical protein